MNVRDHLAYLHDATGLIASGQDADTALSNLCTAAVPRLADAAMAYLRDPAPEDLNAEDQGTALREVAAAGPLGHDPAESLRNGRALICPLRFDDQVQGYVALLREPSRDRFDDTDLLTASLMVDQAARSVHTIRLFERESHIADALQRSMLPKSPPTLPGVEIAHRYLPSNPAAQVGGDWFDAVPLPGGRVALIVGDVMGHGVPSAAAMGQLRIAARTLASLDLPPDQTLRHLDDLARELGEQGQPQLATCVLCVYDPVTRRCTIGNAGHIPPILQHPDGRREILELPPGGPIGLGGVTYRSVELTAPDDGLLVLCTDGLIESRTRHLDDGLAALSAAIPHPPPAPDALCDKVLAELHSDARQDDVALLIAKFRGIPPGDVARWIMRPQPQTAARARKLTRDTVTGWGLGEHAETAELLMDELVANAVRYASRPIEIRLMRTGSLLCEVTDDDHHLPQPRDPDADDEGGRGLYLVNRLAHRWGASRTATGKAVWFELC